MNGYMQFGCTAQFDFYINCIIPFMYTFEIENGEFFVRHIIDIWYAYYYSRGTW